MVVSFSRLNNALACPERLKEDSLTTVPKVNMAASDEAVSIKTDPKEPPTSLRYLQPIQDKFIYAQTC